MNRTLVIVTLASLALMGSLSAAHPAVVDVSLEAIGDGDYYVYTSDGRSAIYQETNHRLTDGVQAHAPEARDTGLQAHNVCYGTFDEADIVAYNDAHVGHRAYNYVPFDGSPKDCALSGGSFVPADARIA